MTKTQNGIGHELLWEKSERHQGICDCGDEYDLVHLLVVLYHMSEIWHVYTNYNINTAAFFIFIFLIVSNVQLSSFLYHYFAFLHPPYPFLNHTRKTNNIISSITISNQAVRSF